MTRGALLFAFNNPTTDYYKMAVACAKRIKHFLNLPVTIVTDSTVTSSEFNIINVEAQSDNLKDNKVWNNKGRYRAYHLSPYDETLLLDTDYLVNSNQLLKLFDMYDDFMVPNRTSFVMYPESEQERIGINGSYTVWATVILFKKTKRVEQIFDCLQMVQENYNHYCTLYNMLGGMYRNDHGLTISLSIVNGHLENKQDYVPWNLLHANKEVKIHRTNDNIFNTEYIAFRTDNRTTYTILRDTDFHCLDKNMFMELVDE
jgi:hypothetical protein